MSPASIPKSGHLRRVLLLLLGFLGLSLGTTPAQAHPFGSRYLAHLVVLKLEPQQIVLDYMVEVPTTIIMREFYQALQGREPTREEDTRFMKSKLQEFQGSLILTVNGTPVAWTNITDPKARNGVGNMNFFTYHLTLKADWAPVVGQSAQLKLENKIYSDFDPVTLPGKSFDQRENQGMQNGGSYFSDQLWSSDAIRIDQANIWALQKEGGAVDAAGSWFTNPALRSLELNVHVLAATGSPAVALNKQEIAAIPQTNPQPATTAPEASTSLSDIPVLDYLKRPDLNASLMLVALLLSLFFGAAHALSPGHGKTLVAAYLIGSRGTLKHALWLGLSVTVAHTSSVILLGLVTLFASQYVLPETLVPYLGIFSGLGIVFIGIFLIVDRWKQRQKSLRDRVNLAQPSSTRTDSSPAPAQAASLEGSGQAAPAASFTSASSDAPESVPASAGVPGVPAATAPHYHSHWGSGEDHVHSPLAVIPEEISLSRLIRLGLAGGMVPCPTATVVLMTAIALNRVVFGLALVVAFSVGLAAVLVLIGVMMVLAGERLKQFSGSGPLMRYLPIASAILVTLLGGVVTANALAELRGGSNPFSRAPGVSAPTSSAN